MQMYVKAPGMNSGDFSFDLKEMQAANTSIRQSELTARREQFGLSSVDAIPLINLGYNQTMRLTAGPDSAIPGCKVCTSDIDEYKNWVGMPNETASDHPWIMPSKAWSGKRFQNKSELSAVEIADIEKAGWIYLFNDSSRVADYRQALQDFNETFEATVYHIKKLVIHPGARFIVEGSPAILLIDEVEIFEGGTFETYTICNAAIGSLSKHGDSSFRNN